MKFLISKRKFRHRSWVGFSWCVISKVFDKLSLIFLIFFLQLFSFVRFLLAQTRRCYVIIFFPSIGLDRWIKGQLDDWIIGGFRNSRRLNWNKLFIATKPRTFLLIGDNMHEYPVSLIYEFRYLIIFGA